MPKHRPFRSALALVLFLAPAAIAVRSALAAPARAPEAPELEALAWMAGHWRQEAGARVTEELWLPPRGGTMLGLNRSVSGRRADFEFLRLALDDEGVVYLASPSGRAPTPFRLTSVEAGHAVFENPEHDFPKTIEYALKDGRLVASIAGERAGPSWTFTRVAELD
jgi:hypothetical protein